MFATINPVDLPVGLTLGAVYNPTNTTLAVGMPLRLADERQRETTAAILTEQELAHVSRAAIERLQIAFGLEPSLLSHVTFSIADLGGKMLGLASGLLVTIDLDAAAGAGLSTHAVRQRRIRTPGNQRVAIE
jgi:hypothetical protein